MHLNSQFKLLLIKFFSLFLTQILPFTNLVKAVEVGTKVYVLVAETGSQRSYQNIGTQDSGKINPPDDVADNSNDIGQF